MRNQQIIHASGHYVCMWSEMLVLYLATAVVYAIEQRYNVYTNQPCSQDFLLDEAQQIKEG